MSEGVRLLIIRINDHEVLKIEFSGEEQIVRDGYQRLIDPVFDVGVLDLIKDELAEQCKQAIRRANLRATPINPSITREVIEDEKADRKIKGIIRESIKKNQGKHERTHSD